MIAIRTKNLSPLFSDLLGIRTFLKSISDVSLVVSPGDGVDWDLSGAIPEGTKIFTLVPVTKDHKGILDSHILALGISPNEVIPLFPRESITKDIDIYPEFGVYGVNDPDEIIEVEGIVGRQPDYIRASINPLNYPKDLLDYCETQEIKVLGTDIFGPQVLREYYKGMFPESFLQAFGEHNSDILEIPGDDPYFIKRVVGRFGIEYNTPKLLEYSKSINKTPSLPTLPMKIYQTLKLDLGETGNLTIPGETGEFTLHKPDMKFNLGEPLWEDDLIPSDLQEADENLLGVLHRYHVLYKLQELHSPQLWKSVFTRIGKDFWAIKMIPGGLFGWMWKEHYYWLISGKLWKIPLSGHEILTNG